MMERSSCPSPAAVERAYWTTREGRPLDSREVAVHEHVQDCETCRSAWTEIESLAAVGRDIEPSAWTRREEVRTTLLSAMEGGREVAPARVFDWRRLLIAPAVFAAAFAIWWAWPAPSTPPVAVATNYRGVVLEHEGARVHVVAEQPDEIVRLASGTITVKVPALAAGERFRVITGDDEIDAAAAAFDATAQNDRLVTVRVLHGEVKLLAAGAPKTVRAGETWRATTQLAVVAADAAVVVEPPAPVAPVVSHTQIEKPERPEVRSTAKAKPLDTVVPVPEPPVDAAPSAPPPPARSASQQAFDAGWTALRAGDYPAAATAFERAMQTTVDPTVIEDATFWRGVALARGGQVATAVHVLAAFAREYPQSVRIGEVNIMIGWLYFERGDHGDAKRHFDAAMQDPSARVRDAARTGLAQIAKRSK